MPFFRPRGVPQPVTPPAEPSRADLTAAAGRAATAEVDAIKKLLKAQADRPKDQRNPYLINAMLADLFRTAGLEPLADDAPSVPVIPGRK
jgi:hypothetical protein